MSVTCFHTFVFSVECKYALAWEVWLGERVCLDGAGHEIFGVWGVERGWREGAAGVICCVYLYLCGVVLHMWCLIDGAC